MHPGYDVSRTNWSSQTWDTNWDWGTTIKCNGNDMWWQKLFLIPHILTGLTVLPTLNPRRMLRKTSPNVKLDFTKVVFQCVQSTSFSKHILFLLEGSGFVCKSPGFVKLTAVETTSSTTLNLSILSLGLKLFVSSFNLCVCVLFTIT